MVVTSKDPPKRFPLVQPLFHETYMQAMYNQKFMSDHWRRIDYAQPMVDDGPPTTVTNPRMKLKHILTRGQELARIEKDNRFLLRNIISVMKGPGKVDHHLKITSRPNSLVMDRKKFWVKRVNAENKAMLRQIINVKPVYDHCKMERDYQKMIRSARGRRYVYNLWNNQHKRRRYWIMSGKCDHTASAVKIDMDGLRTRTAKTHEHCFPPAKLEPIRAVALPRIYRSQAVFAFHTDHSKCFADCRLATPCIRTAPLSPTVLKRMATYPVATTRAHKLRSKAVKTWIDTVLPELTKYWDLDKSLSDSQSVCDKKEKEKNINHSAVSSYEGNYQESAKESPHQKNIKESAHQINIKESPHQKNIKESPHQKNIKESPHQKNIKETAHQVNTNQSAISSYEGNYQESVKESPRQVDLHLDKLSTFALPPITDHGKPSHTKSEVTPSKSEGGGAVRKGRQQQILRLSKLPPIKLSREGRNTAAFRPCALTVGDTCLSAPCWNPSSFRPDRGNPPSPAAQPENSASTTSDSFRHLRAAYAPSVKRSAVPSLPDIPQPKTEDSAVSRGSGHTGTKLVALPHPGRPGPPVQRVQQLRQDARKAADTAEAASEQRAHRTGRRERASAAPPTDRPLLLPTLDTNHRPGLAARTHSTARRQSRSDQGTSRRCSTDNRKLCPERNQTAKVDPEILQTKHSLGKYFAEKHNQSSLSLPVAGSVKDPKLVSGSKAPILTPTPPFSDTLPSLKPLKRKELSDDRLQANGVPVLNPDSPDPRTASRAAEREAELTGQPPPCSPGRLSPQASTSADLSSASESENPEASGAEAGELSTEQHTWPDRVQEDPLAAGETPPPTDSKLPCEHMSGTGVENLPPTDSRLPCEHVSGTGLMSSAGEQSSSPPPGSDLEAADTLQGLPHLALLPSPGLGAAHTDPAELDASHLLLSDDSSEDCAIGTPFSWEED